MIVKISAAFARPFHLKLEGTLRDACDDNATR